MQKVKGFPRKAEGSPEKSCSSQPTGPTPAVSDKCLLQVIIIIYYEFDSKETSKKSTDQQQFVLVFFQLSIYPSACHSDNSAIYISNKCLCQIHPQIFKNFCKLQIRLPDGRCLRKTFSPDNTLSDVWQYIITEFASCDSSMMLMQVQLCLQYACC